MPIPGSSRAVRLLLCTAGVAMLSVSLSAEELERFVIEAPRQPPATESLAEVLGITPHRGAEPVGEADPVFRSETRLVEVTLIASDRRGRPIVDLRPGELQVFDNRDEQTIVAFQRSGTRGDVERGVADTAYRHTLILIDALNMDLRDRMLAQRGLGEMLRTVDTTEERIAVFVFAGELVMLYDFIDPPEDLARLADWLSGAGASRPARELPEGWNDWDRVLSGGTGDFARLAKGTRRGRAMETLQAFVDVADGLASIPGQKNLIWISSGFGMYHTYDDYGSCPSSVRYWGDTAGVSSDHVDSVIRELNATNLSLYPVDAKGLTIEPGTYRRIITMKRIGKKTGGKAYYNRNDLSRQVERALEESRDGYVLAFYPQNRKERDIHKLKIRTTRKDVRLRYRRSYE